VSAYPERVTICEVGPRDGLQNESGTIATADKIRYVDLLSEAGLPVIEASSFVSPKAVPQLADAGAVMAGIRRAPGTRYLALVPNLRGLERARAAGTDSIAVFTAASESFTRRNIGMSIAGSLETFAAVVRAAKNDGLWVRGYVSTAFGCPYEGAVPVETVVRVASALFEFGCDEISIGDTIGVGTPNAVAPLIAALTGAIPLERLALHFHDTRGTALANVVTALREGVSIFDASSGGLGGCPYAPGATGNLATEDLVYMLDGMGIRTGVDPAKLRTATRFIAAALGRPPVSRAYAAFEAAEARERTLAKA
jgi:isopropylmalate/homocitrate/citramalate synthase